MEELPKIVAFDANALIFLCRDECDDKLKLKHLCSRLDKQKSKVVIPTPSISELLVAADQAAYDMMENFQGKSSIQIYPFDLAAAYECAQINSAAIGRSGGDKRDGAEADRPWQLVKFDRQIVAIAKASGAKLIISNDRGVKTCAQRVGIKVLRVDELEFPDHVRQGKIPLDSYLVEEEI